MKLPRGPVMGEGDISREWRQTLGSLAGTLPRGELAPNMGRDWLKWFEALSSDPQPRGPFVDAEGYVTRDWREWLEAL